MRVLCVVPVLIIFLTTNLGHIAAQETRADSLVGQQGTSRIQVTAVPIVYFLPETSWAFGGLVNTNFYLQDLSYRPSFALIGGAYTLKDQLLIYLPFELNWNKNKYLARGELGYYRYFYNYYGIGPSFRSEFENYTVNFPRLRVELAYRFYGKHYAGIKYNFDDYRIQSVDPNGNLLLNKVAGFNGSLVSLLGLVHTYDTRDNNFSARSGWLIISSVEHNGSIFGSDFNFTRLLTNISKYIQVGRERVLALNLYGGTSFGNPPFQEFLLYGGPSRARGYIEGHYRDKALVLFQSEFRFQIWKRFGAVAFASLGNVGPRLDAIPISNVKWNAGLGFRYMLNTVDRVNVRVDYALGKETSGLYITIGEAF